MPYYIVCQKKRNNPRMDVRICQKKCHFTKFHFLKIVKAKGILIYHDQDHVRSHLFVGDTNHYEMTMLGFQEQEINTILSHVRFKTL